MKLIKPIHAIICNPVLEDCSQVADTGIGGQPKTYINNAVQSIITIFFIFGLIYFIYHFILAAYKMIASQGDPKKYEEAQHALLYSIIGIGIIFSVFAILKLVGTIFGIQGLGDLSGISWPSL